MGLVEGYVHGLSLPRLGRKWSADEKCKRIRGLERWAFTVMDGVSRFALSFDVSPVKIGYDTAPPLGAAGGGGQGARGGDGNHHLGPEQVVTLIQNAALAAA